jgi:hypothetical protein
MEEYHIDDSHIEQLFTFNMTIGDLLFIIICLFSEMRIVLMMRKSKNEGKSDILLKRIVHKKKVVKDYYDRNQLEIF